MIENREILLLEHVAQDMQSGKHFYDKQLPGIGDYFWDSITSDLQSLSLYAGIHAKHLGLYRMLAKRFPYAIYYDLDDIVVYVFAILPVRQNPKTTYRQVQRRQSKPSTQ